MSQWSLAMGRLVSIARKATRLPPITSGCKTVLQTIMPVSRRNRDYARAFPISVATQRPWLKRKISKGYHGGHHGRS